MVYPGVKLKTLVYMYVPHINLSKREVEKEKEREKGDEEGRCTR